VALHGFGDFALALVQARVVQGQAGTAGEVLQRRQVVRGEGVVSL
jgi:hypothetical protein